MKPPPFFVVADRGHMKAYRFQDALGREPAAVLVEQSDLVEVRQKYEERFTDQAGAFPSRGAPGVATAVAEHLSLEKETEARTVRRLAGQLSEWLRTYRPSSWAFAASPEVNRAVLAHVPLELQKTLTLNLKHDLVKIPADHLLEHVINSDAKAR
jgi:hypothetical protein